MKRVIVPVQLGCCPTAPRCVICPPAPAVPDVEMVEALMANYRQRCQPEDELRVCFFGGAPPPPELVEAVDGPYAVRVRPDLLDRADARRLADSGCVHVELDVLTFDDGALKSAQRHYRSARLDEMLPGLAELGMQVGVVLAPGLPGTHFARCVEDARRVVAAGVDTCRLHPVLVLEHSHLRQRHMDGMYTPLTLGEAVTVCRAMMDVLEEGGVEVIRVGLQPGPDGFGRAVAGPRHSSMRELIEARRVLELLRDELNGTPPGAHIIVHCARSDETRTRGPFNQHIRDLRAEFALAALEIAPNPDMDRGTWAVEVVG